VSAVDLVVYGLLALGAASELVACAGVLLARDTYDRLHFLAAATFGALPVIAAVLVREGPSLIGVKALLVGAVLLVGGPLLSHAASRAMRIAEHGDWRLQPGERADPPA
jgi:multisubunit Na+/H+ antiporter MnhG subunit